MNNQLISRTVVLIIAGIVGVIGLVAGVYVGNWAFEEGKARGWITINSYSDRDAIAPTSNYMVLPVISVTDGDTIRTSLGSRLPAPLNDVSIRLRNIDTPELRGACENEKALALQAKAEVSKIATGQSMRVYNYDWDKYGGRIVADVYVNGVVLNQYLVEKQFAVPYTGEGPKHDWCAP